MPRWANSTVTDAFNAEHVEFAVLVEMQFATGTVRVFGGIGQVTYNGNVYSGVGEFGSISQITERQDGRDFTSVTLELAGDDPAFNAKLTDRDEYFGRAAAVYVVPFDLRTWLPVAVEPPVFRGFMDVMSKKRSEGQVSITLVVRNFMTEWANSIGATYTHEYLRSIDATDDFANMVHTVTTRQIYWGGRIVGTGGGDGSGGGGGNGVTETLR